MSNSKNMEDKHVTEMFTRLYESDNPHKKRVSRNETDHCNLRNADYIQKIQNYNWQFFFDSTDGEGEFMWFIHPHKHMYGSSISVNGKEGYCRMSYPCGSYFEGLLLNNERFGPGVYTNSAGEQDVGIWLGNKLVRLIRSLPEIKMLQIAREKEDKIKILRYRTMISLNKDHWQNIVKNLINNNTSDLDRVNINLWKRLNELCRPIPNDRRSLWYHVLDNEYMQKYLHEEKESTTALSTMDMEATKAIPNSNTRQSYLSASKVTNNEDTVREKKQSSDARVKIEENYATLFTNQHQEESMNIDDESSGDQFYCGIQGFSEKDQMGNFEDKWHIFANINDDDFPSIDNTINHSEGRKSQNSTLNFEEFDRIEAKLEFPTEATVMTHLLAWNNKQAMIDILKHVFKHRNDEKKLRYKIHNILVGKRGEFRQEGAHEMAALNFLIASSNGFKNAIRELISKENLDVNLADNGGNTGLIYAAASNRLEAIDTLLDLGADINCINDECSTPLSLCILRLLESVHGVVDRAKAFLPRNIDSINLKQSDFLISDNNVLPNLQQWCPRSMFSYEQIPIKIHEQKDDYSILRNTNNGSKETKRSNVRIKWKPIKSNTSIKMIGRDVINHIESCWKLQNGITKDNIKFYQSIKQIKKILDTHGDLPVSSNINLEGMKENELPSSSHTKQSDERLPVSSKKYEIQNYIFDWNAITEVSSNEENERRKLREINRNIEKETQIYNTILKLISRGANPNYPTAPYPVLIMAIFSKSPNLVEQLLLYGADPNVTLSKQEYSLAPLHILAVIEPSLDNSIIAKSLIHANADVNLRTDSMYRPDVKARLSEGRSTAFLDDSEGFTALHLLALRSDYKTDTNQFLTQLVCALLCNGSNKSYKFYQGHSALSLAIVEENIDAMKVLLETGQCNVNEQLGYDLGSCMLMMVSRRLQEKLSASFIEESMISRDYNQLEYAREELHSLMHKSSENVSNNKMDGKLKEHEERESLTAINKYFVEVINFLENVARKLMKRQICGKIVRKLVNFYSYTEIDVIRTKSRLDDKLMKLASSWMNATELAFTMSIMKYGHEDIKKVLIAYLGSKLQRTSTSNNIIAANAQQIISGISDNDRTVITNDECAQYSERHVIHPPEIDPDVKKFMVCFECFMMHNKVLIWCPICRLVLFCSQTCNINNIRRPQNPHTCKAFYNQELEKLERIANSIGVNPREFLRNYMLKSDKDGSIEKMYKYNRSIPKKNKSLNKWKPHELSIVPEWKQNMLNESKTHKVNVKNEVKDMELGNYHEVKASEEDNLPIFTDKKHYLDNTNFYYINLENNISQINEIAKQASSLKSSTIDAKQELGDEKRFTKSLNANSKYYADYCSDVERIRERGKRYYVTRDRTHRTSIESETRGKFKISDISIKKSQKTNDTYKRNEKLGDDEEIIVQEMCRLKNIQDNKVSCINKNRKSPLGRLVNSKNENVLDKGKRKSKIDQNKKYSKMEEKHAQGRSKKEMISDKNRYNCTTVIDYELKKTKQQNKQFSSSNKEERQLLQNEKRLCNIKKYKINSNMSAVWLLNCDEFAKELNSKTFTLSYIAFSNGDIYYSNKQTDEDTKAIDNYSLL